MANRILKEDGGLLLKEDGGWFLLSSDFYGSELGGGLEACGSRDFAAIEAGSGNELISLLSGLIKYDTGNGVDFITSLLNSISKSGEDTGTGVDVSIIRALHERFDGGSGIDAILSRFITKAESGAGVDAGIALLAAWILAESGAGADQSSKLSIDNTFQRFDSAIGVDGAIVSCIGQLLKAYIYARLCFNQQTYTRKFFNQKSYTAEV